MGWVFECLNQICVLQLEVRYWCYSYSLIWVACLSRSCRVSECKFKSNKRSVCSLLKITYFLYIGYIIGFVSSCKENTGSRNSYSLLLTCVSEGYTYSQLAPNHTSCNLGLTISSWKELIGEHQAKRYNLVREYHYRSAFDSKLFLKKSG